MLKGASPKGRRSAPPKLATAFMKTQMAMKAMAEANVSRQKATELLNVVMAETYAMAKGYGPLSDTWAADA